MRSVTVQLSSESLGPALFGVRVQDTSVPGTSRPVHVPPVFCSCRLSWTKPASRVGLSVTLAPVALLPEAGAVKATVPSAGNTSESRLSVVRLLSVTPVTFCVVHE
ncbi:MAG: hypothetical protein BWY91_00798 [bacterium ADurb.BinA028]|nr:MAG: hypothetical protein BWY91_00798 [bacterium ADurb.BinA028]